VTNSEVEILTDLMERDAIVAEESKAEQDYWGDSREIFMQWREEKHRLDALTELRSAERRGREEGLALGKAVSEAIARGGLAEGIATAEEIGRAIGKAEELRKMTCSLLKEKTPLDVIQKVTGLTKDEISAMDSIF
jgi:hypothetical protein